MNGGEGGWVRGRRKRCGVAGLKGKRAGDLGGGVGVDGSWWGWGDFVGLEVLWELVGGDCTYGFMQL